MRPFQTTKCCVAFLLLMLTVLLPTFAAAAASDWEQLYPAYPTHGFNDIYVAGASSAFAVGDFGLISHYNGSTWSTMTSPVNDNLNAVWGRSANDVFAVGDNGTILHYNGAAWEAMTSPTSDNLHSVWGFATPGYPVFAGGRDGDILTYAGGSWSFMETPLSDGIWNYTIIYGIWGYSPSNLFAVGSKSGDSTEDIFLRCTDGSTWQQFTGPSGDDSPASFFPTAIWGSDGGLLYIGGSEGIYSLTSGATNWTPVVNGSGIADIWGTSASDIWAVGDTIYHFDGSSPWTFGRYGGLNAVSGSSTTNVLAAGDSGTILRYQGTAWSSMTSVPNFAVHDLWKDGTSSPVAAGEAGMVLTSSGSEWKPMASATNEDLHAVCGWGNGHYLAAGVNGAVQYYNGSSWSLLTSNTTEDLNDTWCLTPDAALVVGANGTVLYCSGAGCAVQPTDTSRNLTGVHNSTLGTYATGQAGVLLQSDGSSWNTITPNNATPLVDFEDLWGDIYLGELVAVGENLIYSYNTGTNTWTKRYEDPGTLYLRKVIGGSFPDLLVAGYNADYFSTPTIYNGIVLQRSGGNFQALKTFPGFLAATIAGDSTGNLFVGGASQEESNSPWHGQVLHYDGSAWANMIETNTLNDIWGADLNSVFAVGDRGTILHYDGSTVRAMENNSGKTLYTVFAGETGNWAAAGGWFDVMLYFDGTTWATTDNPPLEFMEDMWGQGETVYAVGGTGTILHSLDRGVTWNTMSSPTTESLYGVWGAAADGPVFAAGYNGTVLHYNGSNWSQVTTNTNSSYMTFHGIWGSSAQDVYVVGETYPFLGSNESQIIHFDGSSWKESYYSYNVQPQKFLTGIWGRSDKDVIAFGTTNLRKQCGRGWGEINSTGIPPLQKGWGKMDPDGNYHIFGITAYNSIYRYTIPASEDCSSPWTLFLPAIITNKK
ncbi:MAG: hypothetical protein ACYDBT_00465 [Desulfobulbaceae bacterium]